GDTSNRRPIVNVNKMSSLAVSGIAPFLDFAGLLMFVGKFSIYLVIGATFYFSRTTKQDIDAKHNSDLSTRDTMFNEILANRDARLTTEVADRDARFVTELTDYRAKFNAELTSRDEKFTAEVQRIFTMLNTSTAMWNQFKIIFDRIMAERRCSFDDMCNVVMVDLLNLGKIGKDSIKNYYRKINDLRGSNLDKIGAWIDSKTVTRNSE
ncbi:6402_t:CDS:2, partial [Ambispora gerdemannii]